jgi:hypothetical protein
VRYDFVHTVTHRRLLTQTNKFSGAVTQRGMIASPHERGKEKLPVSFALKLLFFAQCTRAQYLVKRPYRLIQDMHELTPCSHEDTAIMSGYVYAPD